jgi:hypothetical protein
VAAVPDPGDQLVAIIDRVWEAAGLLHKSVTGMESLVCGVTILLRRFAERDIVVRLLDVLEFIFLSSSHLRVKISCFQVYGLWKNVSVAVVLSYIRRMVHEAIVSMLCFYDYEGIEDTATLVNTCAATTAALAGIQELKPHVIQWSLSLIIAVEQIHDLFVMASPVLIALVKTLAEKVQPEMGVHLDSDTPAGDIFRRVLSLDAEEGSA